MPRVAKHLAAASPIPEAAPVTTAILPLCITDCKTSHFRPPFAITPG
jgi:hypothetical protein